MLKQTLLCTVLISAALFGTARAMEPGSDPALARVKSPEPALRLEYTSAIPESAPGVRPALLKEIADWLSQNFDLPPSPDLPQINFTSPDRIAAMARGGFVPTAAPTAAGGHLAPADDGIVAVYVTVSQTIHLANGWRETSPADVSVLVHEMVHHLQNQAQIKYPCNQAREKLAYEAQERWLARHDRTLQSEFDIDRMTLLVRTNCGF